MRCLVVDAHPLLREALESLLKGRHPEATVLTVTAQSDAHAVLGHAPVDLVVVDLLCGHAEDFDALPDLVAAARPGRVVVFGRGASSDVQWVQAAGAHGLVSASSRPELLSAAIDLVLAGGLYFPPAAPDREPARTGGRTLGASLSQRQREVLRGLKQGQSNKAIARALGLSVATVKLHVRAILKQTGALNRTHAVVLAGDVGEDLAAPLE